MQTTLTHNLADLSSALQQYRELSKLNDQEILVKQGGKLADQVFKRLLRTSPNAGSIRNEVMERLRSKKFIKVRKKIAESVLAKAEGLKSSGKDARFSVSSRMARDQGLIIYRLRGDRLVRNKLNTAQEMVRREIATRESGRRFLAISIKYPANPRNNQKAISRNSLELSRFELALTGESKYAQIVWGGLNEESKQIVSALRRNPGKQALILGIQDTAKDIMDYVRPRQHRLLSQTVRKLIKPKS